MIGVHLPLVLIVFVAAPVDPRAVAARYTSQCAGAAATTPDCKRMQWQLEMALYQKLRAGGALTPEAWRVAAAADVPQLAALGLYGLREGYTPADDAIVLAQLDSPYGMVRDAAFALVDLMASDRGRRMRGRRQSSGASWTPLLDEPPAADRLGLALYPGAVFRPFASDGKRAYFTTADPPEKVAAFYARAGRRPMTADELEAEQAQRKAAMEKAFQDPQAYARKLQEAVKAGKDPQAAAMELAGKMGGADRDWNTGLATEEGVVKPRFVPVDDAMSRMVLVFRDELIGQTAIVFLDVPTAAELALLKLATSGKAEDLERMSRQSEALMRLEQMKDDGP
jgi:hypothetical protein